MSNNVGLVKLIIGHHKIVQPLNSICALGSKQNRWQILCVILFIYLNSLTVVYSGLEITYASQAGLKLVVLLSQPPELWDYRHVLLHLAMWSYFCKMVSIHICLGKQKLEEYIQTNFITRKQNLFWKKIDIFSLKRNSIVCRNVQHLLIPSLFCQSVYLFSFLGLSSNDYHSASVTILYKNADPAPGASNSLRKRRIRKWGL